MNAKIEDIKDVLADRLQQGAVSGKILLDRLRVLDESSRQTAAYADHRYAPFYYHLGKLIDPESMMEIGFNLGLLGTSFLTACKTVKKYTGFQQQKKEFYSTRLGLANLKTQFKKTVDIYVGNFSDDEFMAKISPNSWDLVIINDECGFDRHLLYLDTLWPMLAEGGVVVAEYIDSHKPSGDAFRAFAESVSREPAVFQTRYGTGIVQK